MSPLLGVNPATHTADLRVIKRRHVSGEEFRADAHVVVHEDHDRAPRGPDADIARHAHMRRPQPQYPHVLRLQRRIVLVDNDDFVVRVALAGQVGERIRQRLGAAVGDDHYADLRLLSYLFHARFQRLPRNTANGRSQGNSSSATLRIRPLATPSASLAQFGGSIRSSASWPAP